MAEAAKHPYPSGYLPGTHWSTDEAWQILDALPVGMLPDDYRFITSGRIAGTLMRFSSEHLRAERALLLEVLQTASHALKSYAHHNASPDLAVEVAAKLDRVLAASEKV